MLRMNHYIHGLLERIQRTLLNPYLRASYRGRDNAWPIKHRHQATLRIAHPHASHEQCCHLGSIRIAADRDIHVGGRKLVTLLRLLAVEYLAVAARAVVGSEVGDRGAVGQARSLGGIEPNQFRPVAAFGAPSFLQRRLKRELQLLGRTIFVLRMRRVWREVLDPLLAHTRTRRFAVSSDLHECVLRGLLNVGASCRSSKPERHADVLVGMYTVVDEAFV